MVKQDSMMERIRVKNAILELMSDGMPRTSKEISQHIGKTAHVTSCYMKELLDKGEMYCLDPNDRTKTYTLDKHIVGSRITYGMIRDGIIRILRSHEDGLTSTQLTDMLSEEYDGVIGIGQMRNRLRELEESGHICVRDVVGKARIWSIPKH